MYHRTPVKRVLFREEKEKEKELEELFSSTTIEENGDGDDENKLNELICLRDQLKNDVLAAAQNNLNSYMEMKELRETMIQFMIDPLKLKRRIGRKLKLIRKILCESQQILENHLIQLKLLARETHAECHLDWNLLKAGNHFNTHDEFTKTFLNHRKEYHIYKAKVKKLTTELETLIRANEFCRQYSMSNGLQD